jgi:large subunit ribosomal protein L13
MKKEDIKTKELKWHLIDAKDKILGRLAVEAARVLMGKDKPTYVPYLAGGDGVVVINARQIKVTGSKLTQKLYKHYSGYPSGLRQMTLAKMLEKKPEEVIRHAVKGMLPRNKLASVMISRLKVYADDRHPHQAQLK